MGNTFLDFSGPSAGFPPHLRNYSPIGFSIISLRVLRRLNMSKDLEFNCTYRDYILNIIRKKSIFKKPSINSSVEN